MRKSLITLLVIFIITVCGAEVVNIKHSETYVKVLDSNEKGLKLEFNFGQFEMEEVKIDGKTYHKLSLKGEPVTFEKGEPELPFFAKSIMIPEQSGVTVRVSDYESKEYSLQPVPSKGLLMRTVEPATVPYEFSETYRRASAYPKNTVEIGEPYIMREVRGIVVKAYPFEYDAAKNLVTVKHRMIIDVKFEGKSEVNTLRIRPTSYCSDFVPLYSKHFLNFDRDRYTPVVEAGSILVISHPDFMEAVQPYVDWKQQKGRETILLSTTEAGTTPEAIKSTIYSYYTQGIAYVQLVGDAEQVPTFNVYGGEDPKYSLHVGFDNYPDLFVGRFSAETAEEVTTQVERSIQYERDLGNSSWLTLGTGIASHEGEGIGDQGESDWVHMDGLRTQLLGYNYSAIDQFYATTGATAAMVTDALNSGRGILNYVGHGSANVWVTTGFSTTHVNNLTNDNKLPFIHSVACVNGAFVDNTCFAEVWLRTKNSSTGNPTGALAFYGSTINQSWAPPMEAQDEYINLLVDEEKRNIGGLWYNGSCSMIDAYGSSGALMFETWHIFGDASLTVRTANPTAITATYDGMLSYGQSSLSVETNSPVSRITLWKDGIVYGKGYTDTSGNINLPLNPLITESGSYILTISAFNKITYTGTLHLFDADQRIWTGAVSADWHNPANWHDNQMPNAGLHAYIPAGLTTYPIISSDFGTCKDLIINNGANLTINSNTLFVYGNVIIGGLLKMNHASSALLVAEDLTWHAGSQAEITNNSATIVCEGDAIFNQNSNVQMQMGIMQFNGDEDAYIINKTINTQLNNLYSNKTSPAFLAVSNESTQPITINGNLVNFENSTMLNNYQGEIVLKGNFTCNNSSVSGGIRWDSGTALMNGANQTISFASASSYLNSLRAFQSGNLTYSSPLNVKGYLTVDNGSNIIIGDYNLTVDEGAYLFGELVMNGASDFIVRGSIDWENGSTASINNSSAEIFCQGNMFFAANSNVVMTAGYIEFTGPGQSSIISNRSTTQINHLRSNKTAPGFLYIHADSNAGFTINGNIWNYQNKTFYNEYDGTIKLKGNLNNSNTNTDGFRWENGTLELNGTNQTISLPNPTDCVNNLTISGSVFVNSNLKVLGNMFLKTGVFTPGSNVIYVGGNWTKNTTAQFNYANSTIVFNGSVNQTVNSTYFSTLRLNKSGGNLIISSSAYVLVESYKYDMGTIEIGGSGFGGNLLIYDLADATIKGNYILPNGTIELNQDENQFVDLDANLTISGGTFTINGGQNFPADWAHSRNITINMSGGILDWGTKNIGITNTGYTAALNITGGTIKTQGSISVQRTNLYFTGGTIEMYGSGDAALSHHVAAAFNDLKINKTSVKNEKNSVRNSIRANTVTLDSNVSVDGDLQITNGTLDVSNYALTVNGNAEIYGSLQMNEATSTFNAMNDINWYSGSTCNITSGMFEVYGNWTFAEGAIPQIGTGNIVYFTGANNSEIFLSDGTAAFGSVVINKNPGISVDINSGQFTVNGNLSIENNANLAFLGGNSDIADSFNIEGTLAISSPAVLTAYDCTLSGTMNMNEASAFITRNFTQNSSGIINMTNGILNLNRAYTGNYFNFSGSTILNGGMLEITNDGIQFGSGASFNSNSGTLRIGSNFKAIYADTFQPALGAVEFIGTGMATIECANGNFFHDLIINKQSTSNQVMLLSDVTLANDLFVTGGNANVSTKTLTVNRDVVIYGGWLTASDAAAVINVGRNWTNNVNTNAFAQGSGKVNFFSNQPGTISTEDFYNVNINKNTAEINDLTINPNSTMKANGNLQINSGCLKLGSGSTLDANGNIALSGGGLDLNSTENPTILRIAGHFFDESDEPIEGAGIIATNGATAIFDGSADQAFGSDLPADLTTLCHVTIDKPSGKVLCYDNVDFMGDFHLINGEWAAGSTGKTKTFYGDFILEAAGTFSDNTGISRMLGATDSNLKILGNADFGTFAIAKSLDIPVNMTGNVLFAGRQTINLSEGVLNLNGYTLKYQGNLNVGTLTTNRGKLNLSAGSILNINDSSSLSIGQYCSFSSIGSQGNPVLITSDTGYFSFFSGRTANLSIAHTIFEKMDSNGINFDYRASIDEDNCFYYCTFRDSEPGGTLLQIPATQDLTIYGAYFSDASPISAFNVSTHLEGSATMFNYDGNFAGAAYSNGNVTWETFAPPNAPVNVQIQLNGSEVQLNWDAVPGVTGYNIYRSFDPVDFTEAELVATTDQTHYEDEILGFYPQAFYLIKSYIQVRNASKK